MWRDCTQHPIMLVASIDQVITVSKNNRDADLFADVPRKKCPEGDSQGTANDADETSIGRAQKKGHSIERFAST